MHEVQSEIMHAKGRTGRAHTVELRVRLRVIANALMRHPKSLQQGIAGTAGRFLIVDTLDGFYREPTGFLPAFISAHPIRHQREPSFSLELLVILGFPIGKRVFIVLALAADIAQASDLDSGSNLHCASLGRNSTGAFATSEQAWTNSLRDRTSTPRLSRTPHQHFDGPEDYITWMGNGTVGGVWLPDGCASPYLCCAGPPMWLL